RSVTSGSLSAIPPAARPVLNAVHWASDEALLAGMAAGDRDAAAAFVRRFQHRVVGLAVTMLGDPAQAQDVAQEAFLRAWRNGSTYDPGRGSVPTWLLTVTRNLAIDSLRAQRARPADPVAAFDQDEGGREHASADRPDMLAEAHEASERVR